MEKPYTCQARTASPLRTMLWLSSQPGKWITVPQAVAGLGMSASGLRYHMRVLINMGMVEMTHYTVGQQQACQYRALYLFVPLPEHKKRKPRGKPTRAPLAMLPAFNQQPVQLVVNNKPRTQLVPGIGWPATKPKELQ